MENLTILPTKVKTPISPKTVEKRVVFKDLSAQRNVTPVKSDTHPKENISEKNHSTAKIEFAREFIETFPPHPVSSLSSDSLESTLASCSSKTQPSISSFSSYRSLSQYTDSPGSLPDVVYAGRRSCHDLNDTTSSADYESANEEDDSVYIQGIGDVIAGLENCQLKTPRGKLQNISIEKLSLNTTFNISSPKSTDSTVDFANDSGSAVAPTVTNETASTIDDNSIQFANTGNTTVFAANLTQQTEDSPQFNSCLNRLDSLIDNPKSLSQLAEDVVKLGVDIVAVLETQNKSESVTTVPLNTAHLEPASSVGPSEDVIKISQLLSCTNFTDIVDEELNLENNTAENSYLPIEFADSEVTFSGRESGAYDPLSTTGYFSEFGDDSSSSSRVEKITDSDGIITETGVHVPSVEEDLSETLVEEYVIAAEPEICLNKDNEESVIYNCEDIDSIILNVTIEEQLHKTNLPEEKLQQELTPEHTENQVDTDKTSTGISTLSYVSIIAEETQLNTFIEDVFSTQHPLACVRPVSAVPCVCDIDVSPKEHSSKIDFAEPFVHVPVNLEPEQIKTDLLDSGAFSVLQVIPERISLEPESLPGKKQDPVELSDPEEFSVELGISDRISLEPESPPVKIEDLDEQNKADPEGFSVEVGISEHINLELESRPGKIENPVEQDKADPEEFSVEVGISQHISLELESRPVKIENPVEQDKADPEEFSVQLGVSEHISLEPESVSREIEDLVKQNKADLPDPEVFFVESAISKCMVLELVSGHDAIEDRVEPNKTILADSFCIESSIQQPIVEPEYVLGNNEEQFELNVESTVSTVPDVSSITVQKLVHDINEGQDETDTKLPSVESNPNVARVEKFESLTATAESDSYETNVEGVESTHVTDQVVKASLLDSIETPRDLSTPTVDLKDDVDITFGAAKKVLEELTIEVTEATINSAEECLNTDELCLQTVQPSVPLGVHSEAAPAAGVNFTEPVKQNKCIFGDQISFSSSSNSLTNIKKDGSTAKKQSSDFDAMLEQEAAKVSAGHLNASREIVSVDEMEPAMDEMTPVMDEMTPVMDEMTPVMDEMTPAMDEMTPVMDEMTLDPFKTTNNLSTSPPIRAQPFDYSTVRDDFKPSPKNMSESKTDAGNDNNFNMEFSFAPPVPLPRQKRDASASQYALKPKKPIAPQSSVLPREQSALQCSPSKNQKPQQFPKVALPSEDTASSSHDSAPSNTAVIMPTRRCDNRNDDENLRIKSNMEAAQMKTITSPRRGDGARFTTVEQGFEVDESQFGKPAEFFEDPTAFDYLLSVGNSCPTRDLARDSLFVRFDPLVGLASLPAGLRSDLNSAPGVNTSPNSSASSHSQSPKRTPVKNMSGYEHQGDLNISIISAPRTPNATPVRNPVIDRIDRLISLSPASPVKKIPEPVPVIDHEKMQVIEELKQLRELMSLQEEENQHKLAEAHKKVELLESKEEALIKRVADKTKSEQQMSVVMTEYEKNISQLIAEREQQRILHSQQLSEAGADRDVAMHHLSNLENSFTDVHAKYERCKQLIEEFKIQEAHLKKSNLHLQETVKAQENRYEALKSHAMSQLEKANIDLENIRKSNHIEVAKLNALLKKAELKQTSLQENLAQKTKENEELARICDEIIAKVSEK